MHGQPHTRSPFIFPDEKNESSFFCGWLLVVWCIYRIQGVVAVARRYRWRALEIQQKEFRDKSKRVATEIWRCRNRNWILLYGKCAREHDKCTNDSRGLNIKLIFIFQRNCVSLIDYLPYFASLTQCEWMKNLILFRCDRKSFVRLDSFTLSRE